jgi:hypothetical protein
MLRRTSTNVSADGGLVEGSMSRNIGRRSEGDPHEAVLTGIAEVAGGLAVDPEASASIGPNSGSSAVRLLFAPALAPLEPRLDARWRDHRFNEAAGETMSRRQL